MDELPLFPLHSVLFPGAPLRLHIFEERYKRMINRCINEQRPFGVNLIRRGAEALGPLAEPFLIGTTARIVQVQNLADGRMNLAAVGEERFQIISMEPDLQPYLVGYVEPFPLVVADQAKMEESAQKLHDRVERYLHTLSEVGAGQFDIGQFPDDPLGFAYLSASLLQISDIQKQEILSTEHAEDLIVKINQVYRRENALFKSFIAKGFEGHGIFSPN
jgi:Lon protease-like protein